MINIDALNDDEKLAALESIHKSIAESKEIQKKKITTNVELIVKALKKIESDLKQRYDETGQLIANLKNGEDGRDGKDGKDGKNGRDGRDGPVGPRGYDGLPGRNGLDGADGVSVTDAHIDFDGSLIISLSSGRVINVGEVVAADIAEKIKVITNGGGTSQGVLDAIASLQAQIDSIASGLEYQGTWNASTNVPTLASSVGTAGYYYIVATAGSTNLNGITDWQIGDWAVFNGSVWQKIDQTNLVTSVAGRTGAITLTTADIGGLGTIATQAASNVSITGGSIAGITDLAIADGGTGQSTAAAAITALTGTQTSGYYLRSNGTSASLSAISAGDVPTLNQNTTGTAAGLSATLATSSGGTGLTSFTADGVPYATSTSVLATSGLLKFQATNSALTVAATVTSNGYVGFTNSADGGTQGYIGDAKALITPGINSALAVRGEDAILFGIASTEGMRLNSTGLGIGKTAGSALDVKGTLRLSGSTSGYVGLAPAAAAGSTTYTLPSADGTANQALVTNGSGTLSWASTATGTVTSVAASVPTFLSIAGSPITSSGTLAITLSGTALPTTSGGTGLTSFTSGGVVYASSTSALATGSALTFDGATLGVTSTAASSGEINSTNANGSAFVFKNSGTAVGWVGNGSSSFVGASASNFGINGQSNLLFGISGYEQMRLTSTGLGIGTSSPGVKLHVASSASEVSRFATTGADMYLRFVNSFDTNGYIGYQNAALTFWTANNLRATLDSSGNLGIGTSSPAAKLHVSGTTDATQRINIDGTGNTSSLKIRYNGSDVGFLQNYQNTELGFGTSVAAPLLFYTNNSEKMRITSAGNVGIGTSSPVYKLDVVGTSGTEIVARFTAAGTDIDSQINLAPTGVARGIINATANGLALAVAGSTKAVLDTSGNLGLGVTPSASSFTTMQIKNASLSGWASDTSAMYLTANASYDGTNFRYISTNWATQYRQQAGVHYWFNAASGTAGNAITFTQAMTLDASGNLGVGTTSPAEKLHVAIASGPYIARFQNTSTSTSQYNTALFYQGASGSATGYIGTGGSAVGNTAFANNFVVGTQSSNPLVFNTNDTERARIDSSGTLLVGTTDSGFTTGSGFKFGVGTTGVSSEVGASSSNGDITKRVYSTGAGAYRFYVGYGGTVYATSTSISAISDQTLKTNIRDLETGLIEVIALKPRRFDWKNGDAQNVAGFIAQEVEQVLPELVTDYQYSEGVTKKSLKMGDILPTLVKAIQEQQAIIESLKTRLDAANL